MSEYELRGITADDLSGLEELARHLDSVNLPADDPAALAETIRLSERSFSGEEGRTEEPSLALVGRCLPRAPWFRAVVAPYGLARERTAALLPPSTWPSLGLDGPGPRVWLVHFAGPTPVKAQ